MRILIAHSSYRLSGGEDRYVLGQYELLSQHHQVSLLLKSNADLPGGAGTFRQMMYSRTILNEVREHIRSFQPDVVHLHNSYPALGPAVPLAANKERVPLLMTVHNYRLRCPNGYTFTEGGPCTRCVKGNYSHATLHRCFPSTSQAVAYAASLWAHRFLLSTQDKVDLYIGPSQFVVDRLVEWGIEERRTALVRNFAILNPHATSALGTYGLFLGRLSSEKGLNVLLAALSAAGNPPFLIAGSGPEESAVKKEIADRNLSNCKMLGFVKPEQLVSIVRKARFVTMPSVGQETSGLGAIEAMAEGRPILVSNLGGLPELVGVGSGLSFKAGDIEDAAMKIGRLMADDALCSSAGRIGLEFAREELSPKRHIENLERCYKRAVAAQHNAL